MSKKLLAEQWEAYKLAIIPADAPPIQITECRRAFYAGANSLIAAVMSNFREDRGVTDGDVAVISSINVELSAFARDVESGVA